MSVATVARSGLTGTKARRTDTNTATPYVRPADWLALPTVNVGNKKFVGLHAVWNHDSNFVAFTAAGAYTVDWGDGTAPESIASGVQANHNYVFTALSSGTLTTGGYRQAIVTITPQGAGDLTSINLTVKHSQANLPANYTTGWLDMTTASAAMTAFTVGDIGTTTVAHKFLQRFEFVGPATFAGGALIFANCSALQSFVGTAWTSNSFRSMFQFCTNLQTVPVMPAGSLTCFQMFLNCFSLRSVPLFNTSTVTDCTSMFQGCRMLASVPLFDLGNCTTAPFMFSSCQSLPSVPLFNFSKVTSVNTMFSGCSRLTTVPLYDLSKATTCFQLFNNCTSLRSVPLFNLAVNADTSSMFLGCSSLTTVPSFNMASVATTANMFNGCTALQSVPAFNTTFALKTATSMFSGCSALTTVPLFDTSGVTIMVTMFASCGALQTVPLFDGSACTNFGSMFQSCAALETVPLINVSAATGSGLGLNIFSGCGSLSLGALSGGKVAITYTGCKLSATEINRIYTNLGTASGAQAITTSGNWGYATSTPSIATAKGWTVN